MLLIPPSNHHASQPPLKQIGPSFELRLVEFLGIGSKTASNVMKCVSTLSNGNPHFMRFHTILKPNVGTNKKYIDTVFQSQGINLELVDPTTVLFLFSTGVHDVPTPTKISPQVHNISRTHVPERDIVYSFSHTHTVPAKVEAVNWGMVGSG